MPGSKVAPIQIYFTFRGAGCLCTVQYLAAERHVETALAGNQAAHYQGQDVTLRESKMALTKFMLLVRGAKCLCTVPCRRATYRGCPGRKSGWVLSGATCYLAAEHRGLAKYLLLSGEQDVCVQYLAAERHVETAHGGNQAGHYQGQDEGLPTIFRRT